MDLRHMRHFVAVAEERHFGRASRRLNMAQPPLSQSIQRLELNLGVTLLDRSRRGVELTEAGQVFLEEARRTLMHADLALKMTRRAAELVPEVRVAFIGPALYQALPDLLKAFRTASPEVQVRLFERPSAQQLEGLASGEFDIGFSTAGMQQLEDCEGIIVEREPFVAAIPADWPIANKGEITLAELAELPFIQPPRKYSGHSPETLEMFKKAGFMPKVAQEATQVNTALSLVGAGLGCSMVMASTMLAQPRNVRIVPIAYDGPNAQWELTMNWNTRLIGREARLFVDTARDFLAARPERLSIRTPHEALDGFRINQKTGSA